MFFDLDEFVSKTGLLLYMFFPQTFFCCIFLFEIYYINTTVLKRNSKRFAQRTK
jgi:hypothetical protein